MHIKDATNVMLSPLNPLTLSKSNRKNFYRRPDQLMSEVEIDKTHILQIFVYH